MIYFSSYGTGVASVLTGIAARITTQDELTQVSVLLHAVVKMESTQAITLLMCLLLPPLWSSGQSSCLHIQRSWVRFPAQPDILRSVGLEWRPLNLLRITEELLE
jgi:hypothetical protein